MSQHLIEYGRRPAAVSDSRSAFVLFSAGDLASKRVVLCQVFGVNAEPTLSGAATRAAKPDATLGTFRALELVTLPMVGIHPNLRNVGRRVLDDTVGTLHFN
ncbi:MAG: hypothetical protein AB7N61_15640 [Acidimicrobiia bacterium]